MRILLDTRWYSSKPTGVGQYIYHLAQGLSAHSPEDFFTLFGNSMGQKQTNVTTIPLSFFEKKFYQGLWKRIFRPPLHSLAGVQHLAHFTNGTAIPHEYPYNIVTVHDLTFVELPAMVHEKTLRFLEKVFMWSIGQASHLIAVSESTKTDLQKYFSIPAEKITVIPNGVDESFFQKTHDHNLQRIQWHYHLPEKFFLSVSTIEPRKNFTTLLEGYSLLPQSVREEFDLVIVGKSGWGNEQKKLVQLIKARSLSKKVHMIGYVKEQDLPGIYELSSLYLDTSLKEGFGLGFVQAMAQGKAVIASDVSAHTEILQDGGLFFQVQNPNDLAKNILLLLNNVQLCQMFEKKSQIIAEKYRWKYTAKKTFTLYKRLVKKS